MNFSTGGTSECKACPGSLHSTTNMDACVTKQCKCDNGSGEMDDNCPAHNSIKCKNCNAGYYFASSSACLACAPGYFSAAANTANSCTKEYPCTCLNGIKGSLCTYSGQVRCNACSPGYGFNETAKSCVQCATGHFSAGGLSTCQPCSSYFDKFSHVLETMLLFSNCI